ncbi:MAG TPA: hypothetical protein VGN97_01050 [Mesorhizobium sp.]|nr:hypothetical protein [Mesorhizobium sp.]
MDRDGATIIFPDLSVFQFYIPFTGGITDQVMISGKGKYAGFSLGCTRNGMSCSVRDGLAYSATGGAKKLGQVMTKKFGVMDMDRLPF